MQQLMFFNFIAERSMVIYHCILKLTFLSNRQLHLLKTSPEEDMRCSNFQHSLTNWSSFLLFFFPTSAVLFLLQYELKEDWPSSKRLCYNHKWTSQSPYFYSFFFFTYFFKNNIHFPHWSANYLWSSIALNVTNQKKNKNECIPILSL